MASEHMEAITKIDQGHYPENKRCHSGSREYSTISHKSFNL